MTRRPLVARVGGTFVLAGFALLAPRAVAAPTAAADPSAQMRPRGVRLMEPTGGVTPDAKFCNSAPDLKYYGGPVLQNVKVYNVNWGSNINATTTAQMPLFYADLVASPYFDWLSEYNTVGLNGQDGQPGSNQGIARGSFAGSVTISPSLCGGTGSPNSCQLTDAQVRTEIAAQLTAGNLPAPTKGCDGLNDTLYMINFPPSAEVTLPGVGGTCAELCGYHGTGVYQGQVYAYAVLPDFFTSDCAPGSCGPSAPLESLTNIASHELVESVTDPEVGLPEPHPPDFRPGAWHDATCGEIGDICEHLYGTIDPSGTTWTVQQLWSNAVNDCITTKASLPAVCTGASSPPGCRPCACADDNRGAAGVPGCGGATPWCETDGTNVKHDYCVECTGSAECTSPATCSRSAIVATDDTCIAAVADAGVDSGPSDAGADSGTADAGRDSGLVDASADSGSLGGDSGLAVADSGSSSADDAGGGDASTGSAAAGQSGGCGCRTAERPGLPLLPLVGFGALATIALVRRRRRPGNPWLEWNDGETGSGGRQP
jgi:MYXO-CTERM domain-containing protein